MSRILVIDDDELSLFSMHLMLKDDGHDVELAKDGAQGIRYLRTGSFDLIITDIVMPEVEGIEVINVVTEEFPDLPIIAMSGGGAYDFEGYLTMAKDLGAVHALKKPVERDTLQAAVARVLGSA